LITIFLRLSGNSITNTIILCLLSDHFKTRFDAQSIGGILCWLCEIFSKPKNVLCLRLFNNSSDIPRIPRVVHNDFLTKTHRWFFSQQSCCCCCTLPLFLIPWRFLLYRADSFRFTGISSRHKFFWNFRQVLPSSWIYPQESWCSLDTFISSNENKLAITSCLTRANNYNKSRIYYTPIHQTVLLPNVLAINWGNYREDHGIHPKRGIRNSSFVVNTLHFNDI